MCSAKVYRRLDVPIFQCLMEFTHMLLQTLSGLENVYIHLGSLHRGWNTQLLCAHLLGPGSLDVPTFARELILSGRNTTSNSRGAWTCLVASEGPEMQGSVRVVFTLWFSSSSLLLLGVLWRLIVPPSRQSQYY